MIQPMATYHETVADGGEIINIWRNIQYILHSYIAKHFTI